MPFIIGITGTPGCGKSYLAKRISKLLKSSYVIEVSSIVKRYKLYSSYDRSLESYVIDPKRLNLKLMELISNSKKENIIIVTHLIDYIKLNFDLIILVRCHLDDLLSRLKRRDYNKEKIRENIISEAEAAIKSSLVRFKKSSIIEIFSNEYKLKDILSDIDKIKRGAYIRKLIDIDLLEELADIASKHKDIGL
ncbi:MAG: putative adenylate kinase [Candidatus Micrarchaeota archaeon]|nr:MAG: putative adenylate kinase [Candidatus Micrarchaeota archaeon]